MQNFYATDPKNIVNFEISNKSATCGPAATKTSKVNDTLGYIEYLNPTSNEKILDHP